MLYVTKKEQGKQLMVTSKPPPKDPPARSVLAAFPRGIHEWFGLTYSSYHVPAAACYKVEAADEREVGELTEAELLRLPGGAQCLRPSPLPPR
jgi:hypothetical protein